MAQSKQSTLPGPKDPIIKEKYYPIFDKTFLIEGEESYKKFINSKGISDLRYQDDMDDDGTLFFTNPILFN